MVLTTDSIRKLTEMTTIATFLIVHSHSNYKKRTENALKLLNAKGEFLSGADGAKILEIAEAEAFDFADVDSLGEVTENHAYMDIHIDEVLELPLVDADLVKTKKFKVVVDGVNS